MRLGTLKGGTAAHSLGVGAVVGLELFFCLQLKSFYGKGRVKCWSSSLFISLMNHN